MKLYSSRTYPAGWYAYSSQTGWVMFPSEEGGWEKRQPARGLDPIHLREVPISLATNTGILAASSVSAFRRTKAA